MPASAKLMSDRRQDHVGALELVVAQWRSLGAHVVEQLTKGIGKAVLGAAFDDRDNALLELGETVAVAVVEPVLALARDADDHPWLPFPLAGC